MLGQNIRGVDIIDGPDAAERLSRDVEADMVLNALVGSAGLPPTLAALQSGKTLALANKESLVIGGELVMDLIKGRARAADAGGLGARRTGSAPARGAQGGREARDPYRAPAARSGGGPAPTWPGRR